MRRTGRAVLAPGPRAAVGFPGRSSCATTIPHFGDRKTHTRMQCVGSSRAHSGGSSAHPRPGSARFPPTSASSLGHRSRPLVQLSKQGVSLSFWLTKSQRGTGGLNACVWTQAIIPNYSFSFEPARPAGEPAAEQAP